MENKLKILSSKYLKGLVLFLWAFILILPSILTKNTNLSSTYINIIRFGFGSIFAVGSIILFILKRKSVGLIFGIVAIVYMITNIIATCLSCNETTTTLASILSCGLAFVYLGLAFFGNSLINKNDIYVFVIAFISFILVSTIYSFIKESSSIYLAFTAKGEDAHFYQIRSFFESKNQYGIMIFFSILLLWFLRIDKYKLVENNLVFAGLNIYLFGNLIISRCKIALVLVIALYLVYLIKWLINKETSKKSRVIVLSVTGVILLIGILFLTIEPIYSLNDAFKNLRNYVVEAFFGQAGRSLKDRFTAIVNLEGLFKNPKIIIGYGERSNFFNVISQSYFVDNGYIVSLINGGVFKLLVLVYAYFFTFYRIKIIKKHSNNLFMYFLLMFIFLLAYSLFESFTLFGSGIYSFMWIIILVLMPSITKDEYARANRSVANNKRVLHVVGSFKKGGTEAFVLTYQKALLEHSNYKFDVYCFNDSDFDQVKKLINNRGKFYEGITPSKKKFLKAYVHFFKFLYKYDCYNIIHCSANFDNFIYLLCANLCNLCGRIAHSHDTLTGIKFSLVQKTVNYLKRQFIIYNSNRLLACSIEAGNDIFGRKAFIKCGKVINNAIDVDTFIHPNEKFIKEIRDLYNLNGKTVLGNISRFEDKKNQQFIVRVFSEYCKNNDNAILVLGGIDGGNEGKIEEQVISLGLKDKVLFIGPRSDVPEWLNIFDYYLMPSLFEGFGIIAVEAQYSKCYVLASSNVPNTTDIGNISYLPLENTNKWLDALNTAKYDNKKMIQKYNIDDEYLFLLNVYESIV